MGVAIGVSFAGIAIDIMRQSGVADPYTWALFGFTLFSTSAIPLFFFAGKRCERDKGVAPEFKGSRARLAGGNRVSNNTYVIGCISENSSELHQTVQNYLRPLSK